MSFTHVIKNLLQTYKTHLEGKAHKKKAAGPAPVPTGTAAFKCDLCDITCTSKDAYEAHLRGSKHYKVSGSVGMGL